MQGSPSGNLQDVNLINRQAQYATKVLAETIGQNFSKFKEANRPITIPIDIKINANIEQNTDIVLRTLAQSVATKYLAVKLRNEQQSSVNTGANSNLIQIQSSTNVNRNVSPVPQPGFNQGFQSQQVITSYTNGTQQNGRINGSIYGGSSSNIYGGQQIVQTTQNRSPSPMDNQKYSASRSQYSAQPPQLNLQTQMSGSFQPQIYKSQQNIGGVPLDPLNKIISEKRFDPRITTNVTENLRGTAMGGMRQHINIQQETGQIRPNIVQKPIEVITENAVVREVYVDKPYDVIVEKPVENRIEKEIIIEKIIENPIERIIEKPVDKIVRKNVEVVVEKPVVVEEYVDKVIENVIENRYDVVRENIVHEQVVQDNHINKTILKPFRNEVRTKEIIKEIPVRKDIIVEKPVERVVQRVVDQPYDVFVDREVLVEKPVEVRQDVIVEKRVERPYQRIVDVPEVKKVKRSVIVDKPVDVVVEVVKHVDKPIKRTVDRIVEKPVIQERIVEDIRDVIVEKPIYVEKKVEVQRQIEVEKEYIIDKIVDKEVEQYQEIPIHKEQIVDVPVDKKVTKYVEVLTEKYKDVDVVKEVEIPVERIVEKKIRRDKFIPKTVEVEKMVEVPVDKYVDKIVEIEKVVQVPKYIDKVVEKKVDRVVERRVEVPVEKFVEVPREITVDKVVEIETTVNRPVYQERHIQENHEVMIANDRNQKMMQEIQEYDMRINGLKREFEEISVRIRTLKGYDLTNINQTYQENRIGDEENAYLRETLNRLHDEFNAIVEATNRQFVEQHAQAAQRTDYGKSIIVNSSVPLMTTVQSSPIQVYSGQKKSFNVVQPGVVKVQSGFPPMTDISALNDSKNSEKMIYYAGNDSSLNLKANTSVSYGQIRASQAPPTVTTTYSTGGYQTVKVQGGLPETTIIEGGRIMRPTLQGTQIERVSFSKSPVRTSVSSTQVIGNPVYRVSSSPSPVYIQSAKTLSPTPVQVRGSAIIQSGVPVTYQTNQMVSGGVQYVQGAPIYASTISQESLRSKTPSQIESRVISSGNRPSGWQPGVMPPNLSTITESNHDSFRSN